MWLGAQEGELSVETALAEALAGFKACKRRAYDQHVSWQLRAAHTGEIAGPSAR
jgi:hypothetical protein